MQRTRGSIEPKEIAPGVFVGECYALNGEKVYLRMELLTKENGDAWKTYKLFSEKFAGAGDTMTADLPSQIDVEKNVDGSLQYYFKFKDDAHKQSILKQSGYTEDEFHVFIQELGKNGFHKNGKHEFLLKENDPECLEWYTYSQLMPKYIVYACKSPDFQITSLPITRKNDFTVKTYIELYRALLMTVVFDASFGLTVEDRGIYRNPYNVIENTYKGLSMLLLGFTAAVAEKYFKPKDTMLIRPLESMRKIIVSRLAKSQYTVNRSVNNEEIMEINLQALAEIYKSGNLNIGFFHVGNRLKQRMTRQELAKDMGFDF